MQLRGERRGNADVNKSCKWEPILEESDGLRGAHRIGVSGWLRHRRPNDFYLDGDRTISHQRLADGHNQKVNVAGTPTHAEPQALAQDIDRYEYILAIGVLGKGERAIKSEVDKM